jgi:diguanylate cyclase (GGDEF)-like protein/PAS domain S-box-containing protein
MPQSKSSERGLTREGPADEQNLAVRPNVPVRVRTAEERFRHLVETAPDILTYRFRLLPEPGLEHVSASVDVIGGYRPEECLADPDWIFGVVHPDDIEVLQAAIAEPDAATGPFCLRWRRRDGEWLRLEAHHVIVRDDGGQVVAMEGVALDVTERYRLADRLLEAQAVAHLGSWEWAVGSDQVAWSDELYRLFGLRPGEFAATYDAYIARVHPEDRPLAEANVARTVETHQPFAADYRIVRPDGDIRWLRSHGRVARGDGGEVRLIGTCQDITEQKLLEHALSHQALHDHLTGLPNRLLLADRLELALSRAARHGAEVGVLFVDLDGFKGVNDRFGHDGGDIVLRTIAERLTAAVRPSDTVARYGGDEFVAVCEEISATDALHLAHRISVAAGSPVDLDGEHVCVSASVGVALGGTAGDAELLIRDADAAMYRTKAANAGGVEVAPRRGA